MLLLFKFLGCISPLALSTIFFQLSHFFSRIDLLEINFLIYHISITIILTTPVPGQTQNREKGQGKIQAQAQSRVLWSPAYFFSFVLHLICVCSCLTLCGYGLGPARLLCPWDSPVKNTRVGCHFLLQGIFLTEGSNPHLLCLLHWQMDFLFTTASPGKDRYHHTNSGRGFSFMVFITRLCRDNYRRLQG